MIERTRFKAFITKYALTKGIQEVEVEDRFSIDEGMVKSGDYTYYYAGDWHRTREEAAVKAEAMRLKKLISLRNQISKLQRIIFQ
jgi:hypothetical protein